jgi:hypothetical protein
MTLSRILRTPDVGTVHAAFSLLKRSLWASETNPQERKIAIQSVLLPDPHGSEIVLEAKCHPKYFSMKISGFEELDLYSSRLKPCNKVKNKIFKFLFSSEKTLIKIRIYGEIYG